MGNAKTRAMRRRHAQRIAHNKRIKQKPRYVKWHNGLVKPPRELDVAHLNEEFETHGEVADRASALIRILDNGNLDHQLLARKLDGCAPEGRCGSGSCPVCLRRFRRWLGAWVLPIFGDGQGGVKDDVVAATVVPACLTCEPGQLHTLDPKKAQDQLRTWLIRAELGDLTVAAGLDFSFNQDASDRWPPRWQPHWYLLVKGADAARVRDALRPYVKSDETIPRPIRVKAVTELNDVVTYAIKSVFFRRVSALGKNGRRITLSNPPLPLKPEQQRELALWLDRWLPTDRLLLRNLRRCGSTLVERADKGRQRPALSARNASKIVQKPQKGRRDDE